MLNEQRPLKVFLCHARADKQKVRELYRSLRKRGIQPWLDAEDLVAGQDWRVEIPKAIRASDAIIICLSKNSINKEGFVQTEIAFALEKALEIPSGRIFVIPARLEDCEVPDRLERFQWVDLFEEDGFRRLMKSLRTRAGQLERATVQVPEAHAPIPNLAFAPETEEDREAAAKVEPEKAAGDKLERETIEKAKREEPRASQIIALKEVFSKSFTSFKVSVPKAKPFLRIMSIIGIFFLFLLVGLWTIPKLIPTPDATSTTTITPKPTNTPMPGVTSTITLTPTDRLTPTPSEPFEYVIQEGDTLASIAERFDLGSDGVLLILDFNRVILENDGVYFAGQKLTIPPPDIRLYTATPIPPSIPKGTLIEYMLYPGDTLVDVAGRFNSKVDEIITQNSIKDPNALVAGQILKIPINLVTATATLPLTSTPVTPTPAATITPTFLQSEITDAKGVPMVLVPSGEFMMGSDIDANSQPAHTVYLDAYYIDKYEVTNALYKTCVDIGACKLPIDTAYYVDITLAEHPVVFVTWYMAKDFCSWRGARLPTEAEWEIAARGRDGKTYPWGENVDCSYANYRGVNTHCVGKTTSVGSYEGGPSSYDIHDMAGNVAEWVSSLNSQYPYISDDGRENLSSTGDRILRGGSWNNPGSLIRSTYRAWNAPSEAAFDYGFRCAKDANP